MAKKILIVEDEEDPRVYLETLLKENGYETATAVDGVKAFAAVKTFKPDLILLDVLMPEETGIKFYMDMVKESEMEKIPVIVVSGATQYKSLFNLNRPILPRPVGFVEKPIDRELLLAKIKETLEK